MGGARHGKGFGCCKGILKGRSYESFKWTKVGCFRKFGKRGWRISSYLPFEFVGKTWRGTEPKKFFVYLLSFAILFTYVTPVYASTGVGIDFNRDQGIAWGPNVVSDAPGTVTEYGQVLVAMDKWYAALIALGYSQSDTRLDHTAMAKLSNASTGGAFYTFAQQVNAYYDSSNGTYHYPNWGYSPGGGPGGIGTGSSSMWGTFDMLGEVYGKEYIFYVQYTNAQAASAREDLEVILNGGNLGGGEIPSEVVTLDLEPISGSVGVGSNLVPVSSYEMRFNVDFGGLPDNYDYYTAVAVSYGHSTTPAKGNEIKGIVVASSSPISYEVGTHSVTFSISNPNATMRYVTTTSISNQNGVFTMPSSGSMGFASSDTATGGFTINYKNWPNVTSVYYGHYAVDGHNSVEGNWPESDPVSTPQPPDVPDPGTPTTEPQPDAPTPQQNPTFTLDVDISTTNYTADLQGVLDALNDHCIHLQNSLRTNFDNFWTSLSTKMTNDFATLRQYLHGQFSWLGETIQDEFSETRDYLKELFEWLADQYDYSISGGAYNDSTVVSWLKKIYSKLGTGTSSKPVDPVADPDQTGSWLDTLINNMLTALEDLFPGLIGQVADFFGGALGNLTQKFPFSIPWDIAAILGMLVAEPVAPSVEIPAYTITAEGLTQAGSYDIDLSAYDAAWGAVRIMMRIAFALYVCVHTKDFLEVLERVMM